MDACMRRYTLLDECRILLVHGILHLLGFDHEIGAEESIAMAEAERAVLYALHWKVLSAFMHHFLKCCPHC